MKLAGLRDLTFTAAPTDGDRIAIKLGPHRYTASRSEAIQLATAIADAAGQLSASSDR